MEEALESLNDTIPSCCRRVWLSRDLVTYMMTALVIVPPSSPSTCTGLASPPSIYPLSSCHHLAPERAGHGGPHRVGLEWWRGKNRSRRLPWIPSSAALATAAGQRWKQKPWSWMSVGDLVGVAVGVEPVILPAFPLTRNGS